MTGSMVPERDLQETSLDAFCINHKEGKPKTNREVVYDTLSILGEATDKDLSAALGWPINCITPRRGELVKMGLVKFSREAEDLVSHRRANVWKVAS